MLERIKAVEEKLRKHYPKSIQLIDDAIKWMIDNNSTFTRCGLLASELPEDFEVQKQLAGETIDVIRSYGYACTWSYPEHVKTKSGYVRGWAIYIFSNNQAADDYAKIKDWTSGNENTHKYKYLDIYKTS